MYVIHECLFYTFLFKCFYVWGPWNLSISPFPLFHTYMCLQLSYFETYLLVDVKRIIYLTNLYVFVL